MKYIYILAFIFTSMSLEAQLFPDRHTTSPSDSWKSCVEALNPNGDSGMSHWVKFDFESIFNIGDVKVWNLNDPATLSDGVSLLRIDYSIDNVNWSNAGSFSVNVSNGSSFYEGEIIGSLNGVQAKHIILTAEDNHGGTCYGLSETRFYIGLVVPIELASFEATCEENKMNLSWEFADISDFERTEIEWSKDGSNWELIYTTRVTGEEVANLYRNSYTDTRRLQSTKNYYRLKIYDINGESEYSNIITGSCELSEQDITIFPQPVSSEMNINIELSKSQEIEYTIYNILGQQMDKNTFEAIEGQNQYNLNVEGYVTGQYVIRFEIGGEFIEKKFIKK